MKKLSEFVLSLVAELMLATAPPTRCATVHLVEEPPMQITAVVSNMFLLDFGCIVFGNLQVAPPVNAAGKLITVDFGEVATKDVTVEVSIEARKL